MYVYINTHMYIHTCILISINIYIHLCIYIYSYIHICINIYLYINIKFGSQCVDVDTSARHVVLLKDDGSRETVSYDVLIGADGVNSQVRAAMLTAAAGRFFFFGNVCFIFLIRGSLSYIPTAIVESTREFVRL